MEMLKGTTGYSDYAIVGRREHLVLGMKPVIELVTMVTEALGDDVPNTAPAALMNVGVRVRVAQDPDDEVRVPNVGSVVHLTYKKVSFGKKCPGYASFFLGLSGPVPKGVFMDLNEALFSTKGKGLVPALKKKLDEELVDSFYTVVSKQDAYEWLSTALLEQLTTIRDTYWPVKEMPNLEGTVKLLAFPGKKDTDSES